jgi:hypothetical protein
MDWNAIVERVTPSLVKIETPAGHGTGFLCFYNEAHDICAIATAHHVIDHAERWLEPIRITQYQTNSTAFLKEGQRVLWNDQNKDSAIILANIGDLRLPEDAIPLLPVGNRLPIGVEVGWLGYPAIAAHTLCFFSGNISALWEWRNAYLIDGVAINGVSGGPVIYSADASAQAVQIIGSVTAYSANRATGETLPGLSIAQDVSHFHDMASRLRSLEEASHQKPAAEAQAAETEQAQQAQIQPAAERPGGEEQAEQQ